MFYYQANELYVCIKHTSIDFSKKFTITDLLKY